MRSLIEQEHSTRVMKNVVPYPDDLSYWQSFPWLLDDPELLREAQERFQELMTEMESGKAENAQKKGEKPIRF